MIHSVSTQRVALGSAENAKLRSNRRNSARPVAPVSPHEMKPTSAIHMSQENSHRVQRRMVLSSTVAGATATALLSLFAPMEAQAIALEDLDEGARIMVMEAREQAELLTLKNRMLQKEMADMKAQMEQMKTYEEIIPSLKQEIEAKTAASNDLVVKMSELKDDIRAREVTQEDLQQSLSQVTEKLQAREAAQDELLLKVSSLKNQLKNRESSTVSYDYLASRNNMLEEAMKERNESFSKIAKENNMLYAENQKLERRLEKTLEILKR